MLNVKSSVFSDDEQINFAEREGKKADALEPVPIASQKSIRDQTG